MYAAQRPVSPLALVALLVAALPHDAAAARTLESCEKDKLVAAGKAVLATLDCHANAVATGAVVDGACVQAAHDKLVASFPTIAGKGPCPVTGDLPVISLGVDQLVATTAAALAPSSGPSQCSAAKLHAAGKRASD